MQDISLSVSARDTHGKAVKELRKDGLVPGVIYGHGTEPIHVQVDGRTLEKTYQHAGTSRLIEVAVGDKKAHNTLFYEVQHDPLTGKIVHFDLYAVRMDEEIETEIPIYITGDAPAVYNLGGVLLKSLESVEIKALPANLPENFTLDISTFDEIGDSYTVADLKVPEGVTILTEAETVIVKVDEQAEEEPEEELPEAGTEADMVASEHGGDTAEETTDEAES